MSHQARIVIGLLLAFALTPTIVRGQDPTATGTITEVTLYRGQAQVVREMTLDGPAGPRELVVTGLPQHVLGPSLFAEGSDALEVRAVRYRQRAVGEEPREEIRRLDEKIQSLSDELTLNAQYQQLVEHAVQYLGKMEDFVAPTAKMELQQGVLDAETLKALTEHNFQSRREIAQRSVDLTIEQRELRRQLSELQRAHAQLTRGSSRTVHEAVVFVEKTDDRAQALRLSYLVNQCGWTPAYNFRGDSQAGRVTVEYNAMIQQMSGEDWSNVRLRLSTATPALSAAVPSLAPFHVAVHRDRPESERPAQPQADVIQQYKGQVYRQQAAFAANAQAINIDEFNRRNWDVNTFGNDIQIMELTVDKAALKSLRKIGGHDGAEPSLSYDLPEPVSLASRSDRQMVRITGSPVDAAFYFVATPVLSPHAYREAELLNTTDKDLLGGQVNVYLDGRFVGRTELPTVARGQTFVVGFGGDPQLRTERQLIDRDRKFHGGNQVLTAGYRLTIENYMDRPATVRLRDRVPYAGMTNDIRLTLGDMTDPMSTDALFVRLEQPRGILRWDIEVDANASGENARLVEYAYQLEYDRSVTLTTPGADASPAMREEFEQFRDQMQRR